MKSCPRRLAAPANFVAPRASFAIASRPMAPLVSRPSLAATTLISVAYAIPGVKKNGWTFENDPRFPDCTPDTVNAFHYLHEAYTATDKRYTGKVTVPTLWDKRSNRIVNNESTEIIRILNSEFNAITSNTDDHYP